MKQKRSATWGEGEQPRIMIHETNSITRITDVVIQKLLFIIHQRTHNDGQEGKILLYLRYDAM
jgi:hypothetical protein